MSASDVPNYTVPNVLSLTQADAEKSIISSGLQLGTVTKEASDTVPLGCVISQTPEPLTTAKANSKVDLVVSSGKQQAKEVNVPDLKGKSQEEAEKALSDAGLIGVAGNPEESDEVAPGLVFKQSIAAGTKVLERSKVVFTTALAPSDVTVPDVTGKTKDKAKKAITDANLGFDYTTAHSNKVPEGDVITQSIAAGTKVKAGTTVSVTVSLGAKPEADVKVPDVETYSWSDAEAALRSAGLSARYTGDPAGVVVAQDIKAGTMVAPHTLVTVTLASPVEMVKVPNLVGMSVTSAENATDAVGLALDVTSWHGVITDQWPAAGTQVEVRTTVHATVDDSEFRDDPDKGGTPSNESPKAQGDIDKSAAEEPSESSVDTQEQPDEKNAASEPDDASGAAAPASPDQEDKTISKDEAKKIALKDCGEKESSASSVDVKLVKDGNPYYEVKIVSGSTHYQYKIDASSGDILSSKTTSDDKGKAKDNEKADDKAGGNVDDPDDSGGEEDD